MDITDPAGANLGLGRPEVKFINLKYVRMIGRIHSDLWHQWKTYSTWCEPRSPTGPKSFKFLYQDSCSGWWRCPSWIKFEIRSARFLIQFKQVSPSMAVAHQKMIQEVKYQIPHTKVLMETHAIPSGVTSYTISNLFKGRLPDRIAVAMDVR